MTPYSTLMHSSAKVNQSHVLLRSTDAESWAGYLSSTGVPDLAGKVVDTLPCTVLQYYRNALLPIGTPFTRLRLQQRVAGPVTEPCDEGSEPLAQGATRNFNRQGKISMTTGMGLALIQALFPRLRLFRCVEWCVDRGVTIPSIDVYACDVDEEVAVVTACWIEVSY